MRRLLIAVIAALAAHVLPADAAPSSAAVHWSCRVPLLANDFNDTSAEPDFGEAVSYLYVGDQHDRVDYGADALFFAPLAEKHGWYDSAVRLGPYAENNAWVQIEISHWRRFDYHSHVAIAWAVAHGAVEHRDTGLMLDEAHAHRLGLFVHGGQVQLLSDGHVICSSRASNFVSPRERVYLQLRTETSIVGANGGAQIADIRRKRDRDAVPQPFVPGCVLHRHGLAWDPIGRGRFAARGAFYPNEGTYFTGPEPGVPCRAD